MVSLSLTNSDRTLLPWSWLALNSTVVLNLPDATTF